MVVIEIESIEQFNQLVMHGCTGGKKYVFVDVFATWCGPCKKIYPTIEKFSNTYNKTIIYIKVDVDKVVEFSDQYDITAMPTFCVFDKGCLELQRKPIIGCKVGEIESGLRLLENGINPNDNF